MKIYKRRGFTLVEILIVIVVIGVLSAMVMIASTEMVTTAKANNIITSMTSLKMAAIAWYSNNQDRITFTKDGKTGCWVDDVPDAFNTIKQKSVLGDKKSNLRSEIIKYATDGKGEGIDDHYQFATRDYKDWYVMYKMSGKDEKISDTKLQEKLKSKAKSAGLLNFIEDTNKQADTIYDGTAPDYQKGKYVAMKVLTFE